MAAGLRFSGVLSAPIWAGVMALTWATSSAAVALDVQLPTARVESLGSAAREIPLIHAPDTRPQRESDT